MPIFRMIVICGILACASITLSPGASLEGPAHGQEIFVIVKGVTSPMATFGLLKHLSQIPGVATVQFNLYKGLADLTLQPGAQVSDDQIRQAILSASYTPGDITRGNDPDDGGHPRTS